MRFQRLKSLTSREEKDKTLINLDGQNFHRIMIDKLLSRFREPLETSLEDAEDFFREQRQEELREAEKRFKELEHRLEEDLEELKADLEELEGYDDYKDRTVIEDVVDNISRDRQKLLEELELPGHPEELLDALEELLEDFNDLSRKEAAVIKEANLMNEIQEPMTDIQEVRKELEDFLEDEYKVRKTLEQLEELSGQREQLQLEIEERELELEDIDRESVDQAIESNEREVENLLDSGEWQDYQGLQEQLEEARRRKKEQEQELGKAVNRMERGMKKLVYQIKNGDIEFEGDVSVLEDIRDGNTGELVEKPGEVVKAAEDATGVLPMDLLDDASHRKFMDGAEFLMGLPSHHQELMEINDRIEELEEKVDNHSAREKKKELEEEREELEQEIAELEKKRNRLEKEIEEKEKKLSDTEQQIKETLTSSFRRRVVF